MKPSSFVCCFVLILSSVAIASGATVPVLTVLSPAAAASNTATAGNFEGTSPIHFVAYASSSECRSGIASMKIYSGNGIVAYQTFSSYLDVQLPLSPSVYRTVVKVWDNCGGVSSVDITATVKASSGQVIVSSPISNLAYAPQTVFYLAQAKSTCPKGVSSTGVYASPHNKVAGQAGALLQASPVFSPGTYNTVVEEWDNCGGAATSPVKLIVNEDGLPPGAFQFAYMPSASTGTVQSFWISPTSCKLNPTFGNPSPTHFHPESVSKNFPYLFVLNRDSQDISVYLADDSVNGGLTQIPGSPFQIHEPAGYTPTSILAPSSGSILTVFVANEGSAGNPGTISEFTLNVTTGQFTELAGSPLKLKGNVQPTEIVKGPENSFAGNWLFTNNGSTVSVLQAVGASPLSEVDQSPFMVPGRFGNFAGVEDIATLTAGKTSYLYTANRENSLSGFLIGDRGQLTQLAGSPYVEPDAGTVPAGNPASLAVSALSTDGRTVNVYAMNSGMQDIGVFSVPFSTGVPVFLRSEQQGRVLTSVNDRMRLGSNSPQECLVTSNGYSMSVDPDTGSTTLTPGSPFLPPGNYPSLELQLF